MSARRAAPSEWPGPGHVAQAERAGRLVTLAVGLPRLVGPARALRHALLEGGDRAVVLVVELRVARCAFTASWLTWAWESEEMRSWVTGSAPFAS